MFNNLKKKGFTLIEIILFIVVFTLGVVGLLTLFFNTLGRTSDPVVRDRGIQVAQSVMEEIFSKKWDENTPNGGCKDEDFSSVCVPDNSSIGPDSGENFETYDDIDDYVDTGTEYKKSKTWQSDNFTSTSGYNVNITVSYANVDGSGNISEETSTKTDYKMITVEVSGNGLNETYKLVAIKANF